MSMRLAKVMVVFACMAMISVLLPGRVLALSAGVSPPTIQLSDALRGATYDENISVINPGDTQATFALSTTPNISSWVTFFGPDSLQESISSITVPAGTSKPVLARLTIPADTPDGEIDAQIIVSTIPEGGSSGARVGMQVPVALTLTVTGTERIEGKVDNILTYDVEVGYPLRVSVLFENTGNVAASPIIEGSVLYHDQKVADFRKDGDAVPAGQAKTIEADWDTTGQAPADYIASVQVLLSDNVIAQQSLPFAILPLGTLTRSGFIKDMTCEGNGMAGFVSKIKTVFANNGQIDVVAGFSGEVYLNGNLVTTTASDNMLVEPGQEVTLVAYFEPDRAGQYHIKGQVNYEGKVTETKEIDVDIAAVTGSTTVHTTKSSGLLYLAIAIGVLLLVAAAAVLSQLGRRRSRHNSVKAGSGWRKTSTAQGTGKPLPQVQPAQQAPLQQVQSQLQAEPSQSSAPDDVQGLPPQQVQTTTKRRARGNGHNPEAASRHQGSPGRKR